MPSSSMKRLAAITLCLFVFSAGMVWALERCHHSGLHGGHQHEPSGSVAAHQEKFPPTVTEEHSRGFPIGISCSEFGNPDSLLALLQSSVGSSVGFQAFSEMSLEDSGLMTAGVLKPPKVVNRLLFFPIWGTQSSHIILSVFLI